MALETVNSMTGWGGAKLSGGGSGSLRSILTEIQGLKFTLTAGAAADADITVTGITTSDTLASVIGFDPDNGTPADQVIDVTSEASITDDNDIQCDTTDTTGYDLLVIWYDKA